MIARPDSTASGYPPALEAFRTQMPIRFDTADEDVWVNGVVVDVRDDGLADSIEQVLVPAG